MNIKAVELLKLDKNMKFGEAPVSEEASVMKDSPVTAPDNTLNALHMQGMNNIAFQGLNMSKIKNFSRAAVIATMGLSLVATPVLQSCVDVKQTADFDLTAIAEIMTQLNSLMQQLVDGQKITQEQNAEMLRWMQALYQKFVDGEINREEFQKQMFEYMTKMTASQELIIKALVENGKSQEEANKWLKDLIALVKNGQVSCEDALKQIQDLLGSIDNSLKDANTILNEFKTMFEKMLENDEIDQAQMNTIMTYLNNLLKEVKSGNISQAQFQRMVFSYMVNDTINQQLIIKALIKNGKSQEEANKWLEQLVKDVEDGKVTYEKALEEIQKTLGSINGQLSEILAELKNISENITMFRQSYEDGKTTTFKYLSGIYENGKVNNAYQRAIAQGLSVMNDNIIALNRNVIDLKNIASDDTKFNELMDQLKKMDSNSIDYKKFEQMFNQLGLDIKDIMKWTKSELVAAIEKFEQTYINIEKQHTEELQNINTKLAIIANFPAQDNKDLTDAIGKLTDAVNNGKDDVVDELKNIQAQLDKILEKLDAIFNEIGTVSAKMTIYTVNFNKKFDSATDKLIAELRNGLKGVKDEQALANDFLKMGLDKADEIIAAINKLEQQTGGITLDQLKEVWMERDKDNYEKYSKLITSLGIKIDLTNATLADLIKAVEDWKQDQKDYTAQLDRIITLLEGIDWSNPDYSAKLDQVIELIKNFKCNCDCGGNKKPNEGIIEDLEDLLKK